MAEAVLCDLAGGIISKLASLVLQETILCFGVKDELGKLGRTVSTIQAVLLDAEQQYSQSHQVKEWVDSLKDAFYDADDLLDESKLDEIVANRNFHLENLPEKTFPMVEEREQTHSSLPQVVVGRENDKKEIIDFLLSSSYRENVSIISIVGLGGLGKTTLAKLAYNDDMVKSNFELKIAERVQEGIRHLSIDFQIESWEKVANCLPDMTKLRTFMSWPKKQDKEVECHEIFSKLSCTRVLVLRGMGIERVPPSISKLKLIRLVNLKHLGIWGCVSLTHMPPGIGQLTSLEYLAKFMLAKDNGVSKHSGGLVELRYLNNLRRHLEISNLQYVKNPASEFEAAHLKEKKLLQSLSLSWKLGCPHDDSNGGPDDVENDEEMSLEELRPHLNLREFLCMGVEDSCFQADFFPH
ncbi:hypothetical protein GH714_016140 [Hevea brasiliensis]|uniref:Rx N-terminal domain-containing protein n=1 Tax=Hevea brasiliensis TaxID=3981 RepID=A0A6A6MZU9_HEVBR|nr:hypothetical protein GH714_016140 [Hevea brasiliensis]